MSTVPRKRKLTDSTLAPNRYSTTVRFTDGRVGEVSDPRPISVDIFEIDGKWYCQVCRGDEKTQPMGPYSKEQAERIQDGRRKLLAKRGAARLTFKPAKPDAQRADGHSQR